tara:strand:+ start:153 stop:1061 length:909 start_codon:yes stop_codon:yes gene_type:complete
MINGNYCFGKYKLNLSKEKSFKGQKFKRLFAKTGIKYIYRSSKAENSLTLGIKAAKNLVKKSKEEIEGLIFITQSPHSLIPSSGTILHRELKLKKNCFVLDVIQGCSGFPYALSIASNLIHSKILKNCLIVSSETYTKYIDKQNRNCFPIFSDAASAILFNKQNTPRLLSSIYFTDGTGENNLILKKNKKLFMHGANVFTFTAQQVPHATNLLLKKTNLKINDVSLFIYHQASKTVLDFVKNRLSIPKNKFLYDITDHGNTVSSTIPISLIRSKHKIKKNKPILVMGFGVGYSLCGGIFNFD